MEISRRDLRSQQRCACGLAHPGSG